MTDQRTLNALERILRRLSMLVGLGRITTGTDVGSAQEQQVQFFDGHEVQDGLTRLTDYGFTSMPIPGCQALVLFVGGERSNGVIVGTNDERHRLAGLQPGEVAIYDDLGRSVWIKRDGIVIDGGGSDVSIVNAPRVLHEGVDIGKNHTHGGVQTGGGTTGSVTH